ncbi:MAG: BBE domain-containing protein, partial [Azospirillaceae bacterium]
AHPVSTVLGGLIVHPREQAGALLRHYRDFMKTAPAELTVYAGMLCTPDGVPAAAVIPCHHGDPDRAERDLAGLRSFGEPLMEMIQPMPFPVMQSLLDDAFPSGTRNFWKQTFLKEMSDDAIDVLVDHGNRMTSPLSSLVVEYYGGAGGRVGDGDNAFAQRQARFGVGIMAQWTDPAEDEAQIAWTRTAWDALKPFSTGGYLLNFVPDEPPEVIRAAFGDSFERLVALKRKYDPTNFFSLNQNIRAAA